MEVYRIASKERGNSLLRTMGGLLYLLGIMFSVFGGIIELGGGDWRIWLGTLIILSLVASSCLILFAYMIIKANFQSFWMKLLIIVSLCTSFGMILSPAFLLGFLIITHALLPATFAVSLGQAFRKSIDMRFIGWGCIIGAIFPLILPYWGLIPLGPLLFLPGWKLRKTIKSGN